MRLLHTLACSTALVAFAAAKDAGASVSEQAAPHDPETGEVAGGAVVLRGTAGETVTLANGMKIKLARQVTVPTLKHESGETIVVTMESKFVSETTMEKKTVKVKGVDTEIEEEKTIHIARVIEVESGVLFSYVLNAITHDNIMNAYPDHSYVGKTFAIQKLGLVAGKRYKDVNVIEVEIEPSDAAE